MEPNFPSGNKSITESPIEKPDVQKDGGTRQSQHMSPGMKFATNRLKEISKKSPQDMTAFDLAFLFGSR